MNISKPDKFKKSFSKYYDLLRSKEFNSVVLSAFLPRIISFLLVPYVVFKAGLSTWGNFSLLIAQVPLISLIFSLGIDTVITRGIAIEEKKDKKRAFQIFSSLFFSMICGISLSLAFLLLGLIKLNFALVIILASTQSLRFGYERALVKWKLSDQLILFQVIPNLGLSSGYLFICFTNQVNTTTILLVNCFQALISIFIIFLSKVIKIELKNFLKGYKNNLNYIKFLLPSRIFAFSVEPIYSYFLITISGSSILGIYNLIYRLLSVNTIFERIINNLWIPRLYNNFKNKKAVSKNIFSDKHSNGYEIGSYTSIIVSSLIGFIYLLLTQKESTSFTFSIIILLAISIRISAQTRKNKFFSILLASDYPKIQIPLSAGINSLLLASLSYFCLLINYDFLIFFIPGLSRYISTYTLLYGNKLKYRIFSNFNICIIALTCIFCFTIFISKLINLGL